MLRLPPTLRLARLDEVPEDNSVRERIYLAQESAIEEGFRLKPNEDDALPFDFFAAVNVHHDRLWQVFLALCEQLPDEVGGVYASFGDDHTFSQYVERSKVIETLTRFRNEVENDCNLQVGLVNSSDEALLEVFINEAKYISVWGMDERGFLDIMAEQGLSEIPNLRFMDEFPTVVTPYSRLHPKARPAKDVVAALNAALGRMNVD